MPKGGARPGAGRPIGTLNTTRKPERKDRQLAARVAPWIADWVKNQPASISETLTKALLLLMDATKAAEEGKKYFTRKLS